METDRPFSNWNWTNFCPTGLTPWLPDANYLTPCFQQICLQLPILLSFAIISAYHFGRQKCLVVRNRTQIRLIYLRVSAVLFLAFLPIVKIYFLINRNAPVYPIDVLVVCAECVTWIVHFGFLLSLRSHGQIGHRGPLLIGVLWITLFLLSVVWLRTSILSNNWPWAAGFLFLHCIYAVSLIPNGNAVIIDRGNTDEEQRQALLGNTYVRFQDDGHLMALGHAQDEASWLSQMLFYWVNPLIDKGVSGHLRKIDDLFDLPQSLTVLVITEQFQTAIDATKSLFKSLHRAFGYEFYLIGFIKFTSDMSNFAGPIILGYLLREQTTDNSGTDLQPYLYAMALFGSTLLSAFSDTHFNWRIALVSMKMRMALITAIYRKSLEARSLNESYPDVLNLMSTDTDRIVSSCIGFHSFWSIPFQLFITLYLLYTQVGLAFIAGVCFASALIPLNRYLANKIHSFSEGLMTAKDARISLATEALTGAKQIKLLSWEDVFIEKIQALRRKELVFLSKRKYLDAVCVYFWATTPILMCLLTFGVSVLMGIQLNASIVFTSVALLNLLIGPLNAFPWVLNGLVEAWVSLKRAQKLMDLPNINLAEFYTPIVENTSKPNRKEGKSARRPIAISIQEATFVLDRARQRNDTNADFLQNDVVDFKLESINLEVKMGDLVCLEGPVGGGKSSLLNAILGDVNRISGTVSIKCVKSGVGFVSQTPWLQRGTIRENIIWGEIFDENLYKKVLYACALHDDIEILGENRTGIGEGGRTLSGGQRARVALARAVYQDKQIYIMDDILASLDAHVANHVVKYCILGLLKKKTRLIISENRTLFYYANQIKHMENGRLTPSDIASGSFDSDCLDEDITDDLKIPLIEINDDGKRSIDSVLMEETKETGTLAPRVFAAYWKAMGGTVGLLVLLSVITMQATRNFSDAWLAYWIADINPTNLTHHQSAIIDTNKNIVTGLIDKLVNITLTSQIGDTPVVHNDETVSASTNFYLIVYAAVAITNSLVTLFRSFIFAYAGIKAAKYIHTNLLNRVFYTRFQFFDTTPLGRILNRFSSDTYTIDDTLPFILNILLAQLVGLIGALVISLYAMPWLALIIVPMAPIYLNIQDRYRHSSRDIKRLSSNALSPLYAHFTETLQGLSIIRAMRAEGRFHRDFLGKLEESIRAQLTATAAQRWLGIRLKFLGAFLVGGAGFVAAVTSAHASNPELVGLTISYALSITGLLAGLLNALAETEQELVAVERVDKYCMLRAERNASGSADPPFGWPCQGVVSFDDVTLRYRDHLPSALSGLEFRTSSCERIGIVGRTGAGKSSVLAALLRVAPLYRGRICIDGVDIATLPLTTLRSRIAIVPQEPFLFSGTIRENMDPRSLHLDSEIWNSISNCLATPLVQSLGGLSAQLEAGGSNLSAGQKQLLCLSRALLKRSKIVAIDEGTSNLDSNSEHAIQLVLRNAFKCSTVLLIAHRLNGIQQVDRILVIEDGKIAEEGSPSLLGCNVDSRFHAMVKEQQNDTYQNNRD